MRRSFFLFLLLCSLYSWSQERFRTSTGRVQFDASTPLEDIHAVNNAVNAILDSGSGEMAVLLLNKEFRFKRRLMQEHFNENYMESDRFPKSVFKGKINNFSFADLPETKIGSNYRLEGEITIHGVTRPLNTDISLWRDEGTIAMEIDFTVMTEDHGINVPRLLFKKVAKEVAVSGRLSLSGDAD